MTAPHPPNSTADRGGRIADQHWDPERYQRNAGFVPALGHAVLDLLAPEPGERILDLGCGDGALTLQLIERGASVVAVDASPDQIAAACRRDIDARVMDGAGLDFIAEFDAVFSNAALHWMRDADAVIAGVWRALRPGGRFVAEFGGHGNCQIVIEALEAVLGRRGIDAAPLNPWYFPTPEEYAARLVKQGFTVRQIMLIPRPTPLPGRFADWLDTFAESYLSAVSDADRVNLKDELEEEVRDRFCGSDGTWTVDYVRLRLAAAKPEKPGS